MSRLRMFILVVGAVVLMVWLYPRTSDPRGDDVTEVTIWFNGVVEGRHIDVVDAFERRFPEFRGILGSSAARTGLDGEGNPQRLMCGIAGGVPPEVVEYDRFAIAQWAARKAFCDLNPLIEKDAAELAAARAELARLESGGGDAAAIAALTARIARLEKYAIRRDDYYRPTWDECMYEGGLYGIPNYMDDRALYFNTDLLLQAGFADEEGNPQPPDTWEQIIRKRVDATDARIDGERVTHSFGGRDRSRSAAGRYPGADRRGQGRLPLPGGRGAGREHPARRECIQPARIEAARRKRLPRQGVRSGRLPASSQPVE
jgi:ABC-type glycerol-3-phosphate transport system substrate-binding protein